MCNNNTTISQSTSVSSSLQSLNFQDDQQVFPIVLQLCNSTLISPYMYQRLNHNFICFKRLNAILELLLSIIELKSFLKKIKINLNKLQQIFLMLYKISSLTGFLTMTEVFYKAFDKVF